MNWNILIAHFFELVLTPAILVVITIITNHALKRFKDERMQRHILSAEEACKRAVIATNQDYVTDLKAAEEFDQKAAVTALKMALGRAKQSLSEDSKRILTEAMGDLDGLLTQMIERYIGERKEQAEFLDTYA